MPADVTHPKARHFLLAGEDVGVLRFTQTIVQAGHKQRICRIAVCLIAAKFWAILMLAFRRRRWRYRFLWRNHRVDGRIYRDDRRVDRVNRWIHRVNRRVDGVDRWVYRVNRRIYRVDRWVNGFSQAGQKPVLTFLHNVIVITPGYDTAGLLKRSLRVAANADYFNPFNGLCACTTNVVYVNRGTTGCVSFNNQPVSFRGIVRQHGIENQLAAVAGVILVDGQGLPGRVLSMLEIYRAARVQGQAGQR